MSIFNFTSSGFATTLFYENASATANFFLLIFLQYL